MVWPKHLIQGPESRIIAKPPGSPARPVLIMHTFLVLLHTPPPQCGHHRMDIPHLSSIVFVYNEMCKTATCSFPIKVNLKAYVFVPIGVPGATSGSMFTPVPVEITAYEPEVIGLDLLHKTKVTRQTSVQGLGESICSWTWVGLTFELGVPPSRPPAHPLLPNSYLPRQNWADSG